MKRSEQIVELMDDVKKIISQMAVVDVCEEEKKPVEVGKTIMTSREVADMFQEYHSVTYRRIAQLIVELGPMEQTEFKMAQFKARQEERECKEAQSEAEKDGSRESAGAVFAADVQWEVENGDRDQLDRRCAG